MNKTLGIIGGSGLYAMEGLRNVRELKVSTPYGAPSDAIVRGTLGDTTLLFLPRHGRGHRIPPHRINYRANVFALKALGAGQLLSISAVGSLREGIKPGDMVLVDQFIDRTRTRASTFFDDFGMVAHVGFADPVDPALRDAVHAATIATGAPLHLGGTYVCMEGPQFSTRSESHMYRAWGAHVIGMTNLPEAKLAREAELPYASLAMATDYDCWRESEETVTVEAVVAVLHKNASTAQAIVRELASRLPDPSLSPTASALQYAVMTAPEHITPAARKALAPLIAKYFPAAAAAKKSGKPAPKKATPKKASPAKKASATARRAKKKTARR
jgi:5'-methylthioadenosine phosphorylase